MIRAQHRLKLKAKRESWGYKTLMALPRNLVKVFALVILLATLGMIYLVYSGKNLAEFMKQSALVNENFIEHPLFKIMKELTQPVDKLPIVTLEEMTPKKFYNEFLR